VLLANNVRSVCIGLYVALILGENLSLILIKKKVRVAR